VRRVFELKGRPSFNPLIVHVSGEEMARTAAAEWPDEASRLARAFWPGPLTIVVPKADRVPMVVTGGGPTVAVRCPDHHVTLALLEAFGGPLVGPSANPSGRVSPTSAQHVREAFGERDVYVLEGGSCRGGIESTVITLAGPTPRILRPGLIGAEALSIALGHPVDEALPRDAPEGPAPSPGLQAVHYAPRTRAVLFASSQLDSVLASTPRAAVLTHSLLNVPGPHMALPMPAEPGGYAARLYAALREADSLGPDLIAIERPPETRGVWGAIADRLARATRSKS
jgi:L-threonylcarbamoyladenylate synthase